MPTEEEERIEFERLKAEREEEERQAAERQSTAVAVQEKEIDPLLAIPPEVEQEKVAERKAIAKKEQEIKTLAELKRIDTIQKQIAVGEIPQEDIPAMQAHVKESIAKLPKDTTEIVQKVVKRAEAEQASITIQQQDFERLNKRLPDGSYVSKKELAELKTGSPESYDVLTKEGIEKYNEWVAEQNRLYDHNQEAIKKLEPYTNKEGLIDGSTFLSDNPKSRSTLKDAGFTNQDISDWQVYNASKGALVRDMASDSKKSVNARLEIDSAIRMSGLMVKLPSGIYRTKTLPELTQVERQGVAEVYFNLTKDPIQRKAEQFIPGYYVARNWTTLETKDKIINIGIDVASLLLMVGIFKVAGAVARRASGLTKTAKLANNAGKAGKTLEATTKELQALTPAKVTPKILTKAANNAELAQRASLKADRLFLEQLERTKEISIKQLVDLEKRSGLKGITTAVKDINAAQKEIDSIWKTLANRKYNPNARTASELGRNDSYLFNLNRLQKAQKRLQIALDKAGSVLKPRYTEKPPTVKRVGDGTIGKKDKNLFKEIDNFLKGNSPDVDDIENYLKAQKSGTKEKPGSFWQTETKAATKTKTKAPLSEAEMARLRAATAKAKPLLKVKPKVGIKKAIVPKIKKGIKIKPIIRVAPGIETIPKEAWGRMTYAEIEKRYGVQNIVRAISTTLINDLIKNKTISDVSADNKRDLERMLRNLNEAYIKAKAQNLTDTEIKSLLNVKATEALKRSTFTSTEVQPLTKAMIRSLVTVKPITKPKAPRPLGPKVPLTLPIGKDKEKEWTPAEIKSAVAWKDGFVVHAIKHPYRRQIDEQSFHIDKLPAGLKVLDIKGKGSQEASARVTGKFPARLTVDVGNQDVIISRGRGNRVSLRHVRDTRGTVSRTTIKRNISKKSGRIFKTRICGSEVLSRRPLKGV